MFFSKTIDIYENIYNQELLNRDRIDNKFDSKSKLLFLCITLIVLQSKYIIVDQIMNEYKSLYFFMNLFFCTSLISLILCFIFFYKCFFRFKKNYLEMPIEEIYERNLESYNEKIKKYKQKRKLVNKFTSKEIRLLIFLKNSYIHCTKQNEKVNIKRSNAIIIFDNTFCIALTSSLINYYILFLKEGLSWIQI